MYSCNFIFKCWELFFIDFTHRFLYLNYTKATNLYKYTKYVYKFSSQFLDKLKTYRVRKKEAYICFDQ